MFEKVISNIENSHILRNLNLNVPKPMRACCTNIFNGLGKVDIKKAALYTNQNSSNWNELRRLRITGSIYLLLSWNITLFCTVGSRCYSIFTYKENDWKNKAIRYFWPKSFYSKYTAHGKRYEALAVAAYKRENPASEIFQPGIFISREWPWIGYSPDAIIFENNQPTKLLEVKCPFAGKNSYSYFYL